MPSPPSPLTPEPITPEPITPEPIAPDPIVPDPIVPEPIVIERTGSVFLGGLAILVASVWIMVPLRAWLTLELGAPSGLGPTSAGVIATIGVGFALWGIDQCARREVIVIAPDRVSRTEGRLFGIDHWQEPLGRYEGLQRRLETRRHHRGARSWQVIDLCHPDPTRDVTLVRERDPDIADRWWQALVDFGLVQAVTSTAVGPAPTRAGPDRDLAALG